MNGFQLPLIAMRGTVVQINRRELIRRPKYRLIIRIRRRCNNQYLKEQTGD